MTDRLVVSIPVAGSILCTIAGHSRDAAKCWAICRALWRASGALEHQLDIGEAQDHAPLPEELAVLAHLGPDWRPYALTVTRSPESDLEAT